ncbi:conserved hypothetical protein [anaerobic digester metagenome]|jgi:hypothetical protein|uniref:PilZ domain-containing protein n=1 Tax=anaerobic digester metagenome TaxID=1263854 RepID=A0A485M1D9_9ZZZZ
MHGSPADIAIPETKRGSIHQMADNTVIHEQRRHKRKKVKITALLKMGMYLSGRGYAKDISRDGICLVAPNLFKFIKSSQLSDYIGAHIRIMFPAHSLTVTGTIVRIDTLHGEGALSITNTSNDEAWEQICSGG